MDSGVYKIFSMKTPLGHFYVQEMPGCCGIGRDYVIMKDRKQYVYRRYKDAEEAVIDLLELVLQRYKMPKLDLF